MQEVVGLTQQPDDSVSHGVGKATARRALALRTWKSWYENSRKLMPWSVSRRFLTLSRVSMAFTRKWLQQTRVAW